MVILVDFRDVYCFNDMVNRIGDIQMKIRLCDGCGQEIKAKEKFIKCSESYMENKYQKLNHIGDLCLKCWNKISEKKGARPRTIPKNEEELQERLRLMEESHKSATKFMKEKNKK